ncbi:MAG: Cytochrome peroxidase precursor [Bacteroidota bacterium]|jgi:cytochrome c peroxidase
MANKLKIPFILISLYFFSCSNQEQDLPKSEAVDKKFGGNISLVNLENYSNQDIPNYIRKDNSIGNPITNQGATLGRVLFYDKNLSVNISISCSSCHIQKFAFSDTAIASKGVDGQTGRHSMRLINSRFGTETKFFWDERASSLEVQTSMPIQDHVEMGFSGKDGDPALSDLITKLEAIDYYQELFEFVYGDSKITEARIQNALSQFIRSIQSFDTKFDEGRSQVQNDLDNFPNFTNQENMGKNLFIMPPVFDNNGVRIRGGLGCQGCHRAPEFDIDPNSLSNGFGGSIAGGPDFTNTRAPSLRNLTNSAGEVNTAMMHTAIIKDLQAAVGHYGNLVNAAKNNSNLDPRLKPNGIGQQLNLTAQEVNAVIAFLKTLSGKDVYTNTKWSNPFPDEL